MEIAILIGISGICVVLFLILLTEIATFSYMKQTTDVLCAILEELTRDDS